MDFRKIIILPLVIIGLGCEKSPEITDDLLDGEVVMDSSLLFPEKYLLSVSNPNPSVADAAKPVFITCHGYSASTFEWNEFREFLSGSNDYQLSQVLLGGHGRSYSEFKASSWKDWQSSIKAEYEALVTAGYQHINLVGSSTSCALILEMVASGYFDNRQVPDNILFVDPIVIPSSKILSLVGIVGPVLGYTSSGNTPDEIPYWYSYRPQETLQELQKIINVAREELEDGVRLPVGCELKVYKSKKDPTADPVSAVLIYKGLKSASGGKVDIEMVDSELHIYTRLALRKDPVPSSRDFQNQLNTFQDFLSRASN